MKYKAKNDGSSQVKALERRRFLAYFSGAGLTSTLFPGVLWARMQEEQAPGLTAEMVRGAEQLSGLAFTPEEREEMVRAVLPEVLVHPELGQQFYRKYVLRLSPLLEEYLGAQIEQGHIRPVNVPLTVRMVQSMLVGLIVLRILGDEPLQSEWEDVPEVLATLVFDGLKPAGME